MATAVCPLKMLVSSAVMLLRWEAMRRSVFLAIWKSSFAARILLRSSFISLTLRPWVCTRMVTDARPNLSARPSMISAFAGVVMCSFPPFLGRYRYKKWPPVRLPKAMRDSFAKGVALCTPGFSSASCPMPFECIRAYLLSSVGFIRLFGFPTNRERVKVGDTPTPPVKGCALNNPAILYLGFQCEGGGNVQADAG